MADSPIRPFHLSFRNFLTDPKLSANDFWVNERKTHQRLVTSCIQHLGSYLKRDICNLKWLGKNRIEINTKDFDTFLAGHVQYACQYWVFHLEQSKEQIRAGDQVHEFLRRRFLHWLEALSLVGKAAESIRMVTALESLVEVGMETVKIKCPANSSRMGVLNCLPSSMMQRDLS